jgi:hypothetical protein
LWALYGAREKTFLPPLYTKETCPSRSCPVHAPYPSVQALLQILLCSYKPFPSSWIKLLKPNIYFRSKLK